MIKLKDFLHNLVNYYHKRDRIIALYVIFILGLFLIIITAFVIIVPTSFIDIELSREIQENNHPAFDRYMKFVSLWGINEVAIGSISILSLVFILKAMYREAIFIVLTSMSSIVNFGFKLLIARPRPTEDLVQIIEIAKNNSFPSGHTAHYVTFFGFLLVIILRLKNLNKVIRTILIFFLLTLIFSVPFSRVYLGAHWFTDVLAGFLLGIFVLSVLLYYYFKKPYELKK